MKSFRFVAVVCAVAFSFLSSAIAQNSNPTTAPAWDEAAKALQRYKCAEGIKGSVFAAEPQIENPVALWPDDRGRVWVVETFRFEGVQDEPGGVHDIRHMYNLLDDDLACRTVEDRLAALKKWHNGDLSAESKYPDQIRLLEDTDGDGRADRSTVFADDFHDALDGVAAGILVRGEDIYFADIPHLWLLRDNDHDNHVDFRKSLSYGYGVRYNFLGHDLHGLRFGPDGKLYFSIGDRGSHIKTREGNVIDQPDTGSVFRCDPDGSNLELFATGLRNPQKLTFDEFGNLFTGDNNCDHGDPAKWVYVVEGGDSGWRVGFQHQETPTGGGPWMAEKLYATEAPGNAAYLVPPIAHIAAGPSGCTTYPGTGLSKKYDHHFFLTDFRGGTGSIVHSFALKPKGASFELIDRGVFVEHVICTDVEFGIDGAAYVLDWGTGGFGKQNKGRVFKFFDPTLVNSPEVLETRKLLSEGMSKRALAELQSLLAHTDMRVRLAAEQELVSRKGDALPILTATAAKNSNQLARLHAIWAIGQIARQSPAAATSLLPLLADPVNEVRAQTAKVLGDLRVQSAYTSLIEMLNDPAPRVRFFAAISLGKLPHREALFPVLAMLSRDGDKDAYLRHAGVMALVGINDVPGMLSVAEFASTPARMGVALALRRLQRPEIARFLLDPDPAIVLEAARAINDVPIESAMPGLAALITQHDLPEPLMLRVLNANFRVGSDQNASAIAALAQDEKAAERMRIEALAELGQWEKPSGRDRVMGVWRPLPQRDATVAARASRGAVSSIIRTAPPPVRIAAIELAKKVGTDDAKVLFETVTADKLPKEVRAAALNAMSARHDPLLPDAVQYAFDQPQGALHHEATRLQAQMPDAPARLQKILTTGTVDDQQAVFSMLPTLPPEVGDKILLSWMEQLLAGRVSPQTQLDLLAAAQKSAAQTLKDKLALFEANRSAGDPLAKYRECMLGGDAAVGRKVFFDRAEVACVRCHKIAGQGGVVGPDLTGIGGKKDREYLLTSIVLPNKQIAAGYESVTLKLKDGTFRSGIVKSETDQELVIEHVDKGTMHISKDQILTRAAGLSPMPEDVIKALSKQDLRNLVEFLASQK